MPGLRQSASLLFAFCLYGWMGVSSAEAAPCEFATQEADLAWVNVKPTGASPFRLQLAKRPLRAIPQPQGSSTIEVEAPLRFTGSQRTSQLGAHFPERTSIAGGRIMVAAGLAPAFPSMDDEAFEAVTKAGEIPLRLPLVGLRIDKPFTLPCSALDISHRRDSFQAPELEQPSETVHFVDTRKPVRLYERRQRVDPLEIRFDGTLVVVAERDRWVKLRASWGDGSLVQGWVPKSEVTIQRGIPDHQIGVSGGMGIGGLCGGGHRSTTTFKIHSHAPIHESAAGEIWAYTAGTITVEAFPLSRPDGWIQVAKIEGLPTGGCSRHDRIWVHAKHILWSPAEPK